jgi:hypothetical protein
MWTISPNSLLRMMDFRAVLWETGYYVSCFEFQQNQAEEKLFQ